MKTSILTLATFVCVFTVSLICCRKTSEQIESASSQRAKELNVEAQSSSEQESSSSPTKCDCDVTIDNDCQECITKHLMNGDFSKTQSLTWDNCNNGCPNVGVQTSITFCYDKNPTPNSCGLIVKFNGLPPCLAGCYLADSICIKSTAYCTGNNKEVIVTGSFLGVDGQNHEYQFTYGNDPKVKLCCGNICCTGETTFN